ncbi:MAG TPA: hypothetical protein DCR21_05520 [Succinivibrionaceae bacterium]|nr:hypothetical protein [Succinivibrionaceae bacterium]
MEFDLLTFIIVCPLVGLAGFIDGIAGGGGLISLPAYFIAGVPPHLALGTNKMSAALGTFTATFRYFKEGYINIPFSLFCLIFAGLGSVLGTQLVLCIDQNLIKICMLFVLPVVAFLLFFSKSLKNSEKNSRYIPPVKRHILGALVSFSIGIYDGLVGPGTGTFLIVLLIIFDGLKLSTANGTSKVINLATNIASLAVFLYHGEGYLLLGLVAGIFSVLGNYLGTKFFDKKGLKGARIIMLTVIFIFFIKIGFELGGY